MKDKSQGLSLLDIGPLYTDVPGPTGKAVRVFGVSAKGVFTVFARFPAIGQWFKGGRDLKVSDLIAQAPEAVAALIAAGTGAPGNPEAEAIADRLPVEFQLDLLQAIFGLTFTNGFGPFVQRIVALSPEAVFPSSGKASGTTSLPQSNPASPPGTTA